MSTSCGCQLHTPPPALFQGEEQRGKLAESELPALSDPSGTTCLELFPSERVSKLIIDF